MTLGWWWDKTGGRKPESRGRIISSEGKVQDETEEWLKEVACRKSKRGQGHGHVRTEHQMGHLGRQTSKPPRMMVDWRV